MTILIRKLVLSLRTLATASTGGNKKPWAEHFYASPHFALTEMQRNADLPSFSSSIDFIKKSLQLSSKPAVVFDQCCGTGLYSLVLGKKLAPSSKVIGVDISAVQIEHAKNEAAKQQLTGICDFMIGDACTYTPKLLCDGAFNINSSFGYSDSDKTNIKMLNRVYETLKPGGRFILEYRNMSYLNANFVFSQSEQYKTPDGTITTVTWHAHKDSRKLYKNYGILSISQGKCNNSDLSRATF